MAGQAPLDEDRLRLLAAAFSGALLRPGDQGYEEVRKIHNGLIDKRPALIGPPSGDNDDSDRPVRGPLTTVWMAT